MIKSVILLVVGIILLVKGSDFFVDSGSKIGKTLHISELILGVTIISLGTSLPELVVSITGAQSGNDGISLGNILGTNIFNICGILGTLAIIQPIKFKKETVRKDMYMTAAAAFILFVLMADKFLGGGVINTISCADGLVLLTLFGIFIYYTLYNHIDTFKEKDAKEEDKEIKIKAKDKYTLLKNIIIMIISIAMVFFGARWVVNSVADIAHSAGISETLISILVVGIGTSLPEIFTSIAALKKDKMDIVIGNLIGSNIFNILLILGLAATIDPISLEMDSVVIDALIFFLVMILCIVFAKTKKKLEFARMEGIALLLIYLAYASFVFIRG